MSKGGAQPAEPHAAAKDFRPMIHKAMEAGWSLTRTGSGHVKLTAPDGSYSTPVPSQGNRVGSGSLLRRVKKHLRDRGVDC